MIMDRRTLSFLGLGILIGAIFSSGLFAWLSHHDGSTQDNLVLKLAHVLPPEAPVHSGMERFAELVAEKSGGKVEVQLFPSGQLGSETETLEQLQRGALAMVKTSTSAMEGFVPEMALFGLPYLFRDEAHFWEVLGGPVGESMLAKGEPFGMIGLCYYDAGARSFYTVKSPVLTPKDVVGKKIRVTRSPSAIAMIEVLGGGATPIPFGELYTALQQGMVDGAENNPPSYFDTRHYEVAPYYSLDEHTRVPDMLVFSSAIWEGLTARQQQWLREAAQESVPYQREVWNAYVNQVMAALKEGGVTIYRPDQTPFREATAPLLKRFEGTAVEPYLKQVLEMGQ